MAVPMTLQVMKGDTLVAEKDFDRDIIKIGRLSSAHLCLDDEKVSRIHSVIESGADGSLSIIDMGSVEGTFVNGKRVNKGALAFGDEIRVGSTLIRLMRPGAQAEALQAAASVPVAVPAEAPVAAAPVQVVPVAPPAPRRWRSRRSPSRRRSAPSWDCGRWTATSPTSPRRASVRRPRRGVVPRGWSCASTGVTRWWPATSWIPRARRRRSRWAAPRPWTSSWASGTSPGRTSRWPAPTAAVSRSASPSG